mgnify:CR=1 FL=1
MTVTEQKPREVILAMLPPGETICIVGCGCCARLCESGGAPQVEAMARCLTAEGRKVIAALVPAEACHATDTPAFLRTHEAEVAGADCILAMCCDSGVRVIAEALCPKPVKPALQKPETEVSTQEGQT